MFRPYNFTSLAAWTFGSIAGNNAAAKARQRFPRTISRKAYYPPAFISFDDKLVKIGKEVKSLVNAVGGKVFLGNGMVNLTPIVKLLVYNVWLQLQRTSLKYDIEQLSRENDSFPAAILNFQNTVQVLVVEFNSYANELRQSIDQGWGLSATDKKTVFDMMAKQQNLFQVNECSFKLVGFGAGRLLIRGRDAI